MLHAAGADDREDKGLAPATKVLMTRSPEEQKYKTLRRRGRCGEGKVGVVMQKSCFFLV
jgi:hypothetical protein